VAAEDGPLNQPMNLFPSTGTVITAPQGAVDVFLDWDTVENATRYELYLFQDGVGLLLFESFDQDSPDQVPPLVVNLLPGTYSWALIAISGSVDHPFFSLFSELQTFDIVKDLSRPLITNVFLNVENNKRLHFIFAAGAPLPVTVDIYHFGMNSTHWESYLTQTVTDGSVTLPIDGDGFAVGDIVNIVGKSAGGVLSIQKSFILLQNNQQ
jgi:hypothetical protein